MVSGVPGLDRVLGGGFVPGMSALLTGEPGSGKTTLALMAAYGVARLFRRAALFCSGEQIAQDVRRAVLALGLSPKAFHFIAPPQVDLLTYLLKVGRPSFVVVDSVQYLHSKRHAEPNILQRVDMLDRLLWVLKRRRISSLFLSQVNSKAGAFGGAKLEHAPDAVLRLEVQKDSSRFLWASKVRGGAAGHNLGARLIMGSRGLTEQRA